MDLQIRCLPRPRPKSDRCEILQTVFLPQFLLYFFTISLFMTVVIIEGMFSLNWLMKFIGGRTKYGIYKLVIVVFVEFVPWYWFSVWILIFLVQIFFWLSSTFLCFELYLLEFLNFLLPFLPFVSKDVIITLCSGIFMQTGTSFGPIFERFIELFVTRSFKIAFPGQLVGRRKYVTTKAFKTHQTVHPALPSIPFALFTSLILLAILLL